MNILIRSALYIIPFCSVFYSCNNKPDVKLNVALVEGDYTYVRTKTMGGFDISGEWKLKIIRNGEGDYSYNYTYLVKDGMYGGVPKIEQASSGKFGQAIASNGKYKWYLTGDLTNSYVIVPNEGFTTAPGNLDFYSATGDEKYFQRVNAPELSTASSLKPTILATIDTSKVFFKDKRFNALNFILDRNISINNVLGKYNADYSLIRPLNNNNNSKAVTNKLLNECANQLSNSGSTCSKIWADVKEGAPLYEVYLEKEQSDLFEGRFYVNNRYVNKFILVYISNEFLEIPENEIKECDFLLREFNALSVFNDRTKIRDPTESVIEFKGKMNVTKAKKISFKNTKWYALNKDYIGKASRPKNVEENEQTSEDNSDDE
jgi:hypothetical protein